MKKILQIVFNDFTNDSRVLRHSLSAVRAGYKVDIVALHRESLPIQENIEGAEVYRVPLRTRSLPKSLPFQLVKYAELFFFLLKRIHLYDLIHCNDLDPLLMAILLKKLSRNRIQIVYDAHELQTERFLKNPAWQTDLKKNLESKLVSYVDRFITVGPLIAAEYAKRYNVRPPEVIYNCPYSQKGEKKDHFRSLFGIPADHKIFIYQGLISAQRSTDKLIEAFSHPEMPKNVSLVLLGYGPLVQSDRPKALSHRIYHHPAVKYGDLLSYTRSADYGLLTIENNCTNHNLCLPNKFFEYAMAGLPVLTTNLLQVSEFLKEYPMGITCNSMTPRDIVSGVQHILEIPYESMRQQALRVSSLYNWEAQEKKLLQVYESTLQSLSEPI